MSQPDVPTGWPAVGPAPRLLRLLRLLLGATFALFTVVLVGWLIIGIPGPPPSWRPAATVAGLLIAVPSLGYGWWMLLRGELRQAVPGGRAGSAGTWPERRRRRRTLLAGGYLDDDDRHRIAAELAGVPTLRWLICMLGAVSGINLATTSAGADGSAVDVALLVLCAVPVLVLLMLAGMLLRMRPVSRAAAAVGAVPAEVAGQGLR